MYLACVFIVSWLILSAVSYHCMLRRHSSLSGGRSCGNPLMKRRYMTGSGCAAGFFAAVITLICYFCHHHGSSSLSADDFDEWM